MTTSYAVIGSGFRAFCNCMHLSQAGAQEIYMIDPAKSFGGVMNSRKVGDFFVDNGVHMFDSVPIELAEIVNEIMQKDIGIVLCQKCIWRKNHRGFFITRPKFSAR